MLQALYAGFRSKDTRGVVAALHGSLWPFTYLKILISIIALGGYMMSLAPSFIHSIQ